MYLSDAIFVSYGNLLNQFFVLYMENKNKRLFHANDIRIIMNDLKQKVQPAS